MAYVKAFSHAPLVVGVGWPRTMVGESVHEWYTVPLCGVHRARVHCARHYLRIRATRSKTSAKQTTHIYIYICIHAGPPGTTRLACNTFKYAVIRRSRNAGGLAPSAYYLRKAEKNDITVGKA